MTMDIQARFGDKIYSLGTVTWGHFADLCFSIAPAVSATCKHWYTNDGDGLNADQTIKLAGSLETRILDGTVDEHIAARLFLANSLPDEICKYCNGTGIRTDAIGLKFGFSSKPIQDPDHPRYAQSGWCNGCDGKGHLRPFDSHYDLTKQTVEELTSFLRTSGGFRIW